MLIAALLGAATLLLTPSFSSAKGPKDKDARTVTYLTIYDPPGAAPPVESVHVGKVGKSTKLDIVGTGKAELVATFEVLTAGGARLTVDRVTHKHASPDTLPLAITAIATIPQSGARTAGVGYDTLASSAPQSFQGDFDFQDGATSVMFASASPGATLDVVASLFTPGAPGVDPNVVRVGFEPVPASGSAAVRADAASAEVALASATPTSVDVHAEAGAVVLDAAVPDVPTSLTLGIVDEGTAGKAVTYQATAPVSEISATLRETSGAMVIVQETLVALEDAPTAIEIVQAVPGSVELAANTAVGSADVAFARGGAAETLDPLVDPAYVYHFDDGTTSSTSMRLLGVESASAALAGDLSFQAAAQAGPIRLLLEDGARTIDGRITDAPSHFHLAYSPSAGTLESVASGAIGRIRLAANDPAGLLGRATSVELLVQGVPTALTLDLSQSGGSVSVDAHGQQIGLVEFTATNGPSPTIPASRDGLELRDQGSPYLLSGRLTGLRRASVNIAPDPDLFVDATGNRVFQADLNAREGSEDVYLRATLDRLKPATRVRISPHVDGSRLLYSAAAAANSLVFATNGDDESDFIEVSLAPVPAALEVCSSEDTACSSSSGAANAGAVRVHASEHVTIDLFECALPLTGCTQANATSSTALTNLRARALALDTNVGSGGTSGRLFVDTNNHEATGSIAKRLPNAVVDRLTAQLPNGFRAQNRTVSWGISSSFPFLPFVNRSGTITCPPGTALDARLVSLITVDLDFFAC